VTNSAGAFTGQTLGREPPKVKDEAMETRGTRSERRQLGAFYTPPALVNLLIREVLEPAFDKRSGRSTPPMVIDPSCGDGRLLAAAGEAIRQHYGVDPTPFLVGAELDKATALDTRRRLGCTVLVGDARAVLQDDAHLHAYGAVIGNPPYLSQLAASTARGGRSALGGGPYADVAAEFLALSLRLARPEGARIGLVLPMSILATRDVAPIRADVEASACIDLCWWADEPVFDANVRTCILGFVTGEQNTGGSQHSVRRFRSTELTPVAPVTQPASASQRSWSWLVADALGVPPLVLSDNAGTLGDIALCRGDFRDQYYGLVGAVSDTADGPSLITSGLIDAGVCRWGRTPTRFGKVRYDAPRVDLSLLDPKLRAWAESRLVPKVLIASQTKAIEAVADPTGAWIPSVPVVSVMPNDPADVWRIAALLTSPVASAWLAHERAGTGLSAQTIRVVASDLARLPLPVDQPAWDEAVTLLASGDIAACGRQMMRAHAIDSASAFALYDWWLPRVSGSTARTG